MTTVYVVWNILYENYHVRGVFDDEELAREFARDGDMVDEFELNATNGDTA